MKSFDYSEFIVEKYNAAISLGEDSVKYEGKGNCLYYSSNNSLLEINGQVYQTRIPPNTFIGMIETTVLNVQQLLDMISISVNSGFNYRFNPINSEVHKVGFDFILQKGKLRLFYYNATTYGMHVLVENDTIVYLCDGFNQREVILKGKNINIYRAFLIRCVGCYENKISESKLVLAANCEPKCSAFCFWGSGYVDAYGNSGLHMPNLAVKLHSVLPDYIMQISWETTENNKKNWFEQNLSLYKTRVMGNLNNTEGKKIFIGHSQGCLFALALAQIVNVDALILLTPQTIETYDFFISQKEINASHKDVEHIFEELFRSIHSTNNFEESKYTDFFGNDYYRIASLLSLQIGKLYREVNCPCLLLFGENDVQVNIENYYEGKRLENYNTHIHAQMIPGMHHFLAESTFGSWGDYSEWKPLAHLARLKIKEFIENEVLL